jgi:hypothetical protein
MNNVPRIDKTYFYWYIHASVYNGIHDGTVPFWTNQLWIGGSMPVEIQCNGVEMVAGTPHQEVVGANVEFTLVLTGVECVDGEEWVLTAPPLNFTGPITVDATNGGRLTFSPSNAPPALTVAQTIGVAVIKLSPTNPVLEARELEFTPAAVAQPLPTPAGSESAAPPLNQEPSWWAEKLVNAASNAVTIAVLMGLVIFTLMVVIPWVGDELTGSFFANSQRSVAKALEDERQWLEEQKRLESIEQSLKKDYPQDSVSDTGEPVEQESAELDNGAHPNP